MKQLIGHVSPETAKVVDDYPYSWKLRCQIRYWIESKPKFGQRFVSQTLNPKTDKWNAPKAGTYSQVLVMVELDNGHVENRGIGIYASEEELDAFEKEYQLDKFQQKGMQILRLVREASKKVVWRIHNQEETK